MRLQEVPEATLNCGYHVKCSTYIVQNYPDHKDNSMTLFINIRFCFSLRTQVVTTFVLINYVQLMAFVVFLWILLHLYLVSHLVP